ncbi:M23 family metallopeptidase [Cerasibacillus terrae]|uniref:M23 family metallopeptidase n=1 Tax=Cerasibacillus terrae TaxID=2498845 RepID=A0A5C8P3D7_9BACI|nr:M23 family metallopeptidase [Cerasibacillus terrae]TXL68091.1 M23 family metallopeptidase [Cerasibacillus terrae]
MNNGVNKIRKSINKRKSLRKLHTPEEKQIDLKHISPLPQDEEKHGGYNMYPDVPVMKMESNSNTSGFVLKGFLSIVLFLGSAFIYQTESEQFSSMKRWTSAALQNEFPFAKANEWYQETFGNPFFLSHDADVSVSENNTSPALPINGNVEETFQKNGTGVLIGSESTTNVAALQKGIVIFAGNDPKTKKTVTVQHSDGSNTTYGFLSSIDVHLYQSIQENQQIGEFQPTEKSQHVYFAIEKDNQYVDPLQVIQVDDQS